MKILVFNCGSSSIRYRLFKMRGKKVLAKGMLEMSGMNGSLIQHKNEPGNQAEFVIAKDTMQIISMT